MPGDLYQFATPSKAKPYLSISGKEHDISHASSTRGYANLSRNWQAGDVIELDLPMPVRRVLANDRVAANQGRVALQRGPLVYCIEAIDNGGLRTDAIALPDDAELAAQRQMPNWRHSPTAVSGRFRKPAPRRDSPGPRIGNRQPRACRIT